jgi:hypothetical protein
MMANGRAATVAIPPGTAIEVEAYRIPCEGLVRYAAFDDNLESVYLRVFFLNQEYLCITISLFFSGPASIYSNQISNTEVAVG